MRTEVCVVALLLYGCATQPDVLIYSRADSSGSPYDLDEYSVKDSTKGPHSDRPTPEVWKKAEAFCATKGTPAVRQEQESPPSGTYVFRCIPRADHAIAQ
jgi:ABC-type phosphate transport system substrate-binding protein